MLNNAEVTYQVPGGDIIDKLLERADAAEAVAEELTQDGEEGLDACSRGTLEMARRDAETFRLRAKYLNLDQIFTVTAGTLEDIFMVRDHSGDFGRGQPAETRERSW